MSRSDIIGVAMIAFSLGFIMGLFFATYMLDDSNQMNIEQNTKEIILVNETERAYLNRSHNGNN